MLDKIVRYIAQLGRALIRLIFTHEFSKWLGEQPKQIQHWIEARLHRIAVNHWGDTKYFDGIIELRWRNGLRIYARRMSKEILILLYGGTKSGQEKDIKKAKRIAKKITY